MTQLYELTECPVCGSHDTTEIANQAMIADEVAALWQYHTRRMEPTTDPSDLVDRVAFSQAPPIRVAQCNVCTHYFRNPRERGITGIYGGEDVSNEAMQSLFDAQRKTFNVQVERLSRYVTAGARGLEIGSYVGAFLAAARDTGWHFTGVDVNESAVAFARSLGLNVSTGTIDNVPARRDLDVVAFWNCFEQLADVRAAARAAALRLRDGGIITVRVPNGEYWARMRQRLDGPLAHVARAALAQNNLLSFPCRNGFTVTSLKQLLASCGFAVIESIGEFSLPVAAAGAPWWASVEARAIHGAVRALQPVTGAPWMEVYARLERARDD